MSKSYVINGFVTVKIPILEEDFSYSGSDNISDVADFYCELFEIKLGRRCKVIEHKLEIKEY